MTRLLIAIFVFVLMMTLPPQPLAQAEQLVQMDTGLSDLAMLLHFDDAFADMQKMQLRTKPKILAQSFPVDDPNAYSDLIAKIYDPQAVRAEFDQILQNAQISTATQNDAVTFYSGMTPFDLTWHEVLANRLYMFEPNEVQWAREELSRMLNPMMDQTRLIRYAELAQATAIKDTQMSCAKSALTAFYRALVERGVLALSDADIILTVTTTTARLQDYVNDYVDVYPILAYRGRSIYQIDDYLAFLNSAAGREFTTALRESNSTLCARLARQEGLGVATILAEKGA